MYSLLSLTLMSHLSLGLSLFWAEQDKTNGNSFRSRDGRPGSSFPCFFVQSCSSQGSPWWVAASEPTFNDVFPLSQLRLRYRGLVQTPRFLPMNGALSLISYGDKHTEGGSSGRGNDGNGVRSQEACVWFRKGIKWILRARSQVLLCLFKRGGVGEYKDGEGALVLMDPFIPKEAYNPISCWLRDKCPLG